MVGTLSQIEKGIAPREKQGEYFTIAPMLNKKMAEIDWNKQTAEEIYNLVRGLNPIMGAYAFYNNKKIKFWKVKIVDEKEKEDILKQEIGKEKIESATPGDVLLEDSKKGLYIKAKDGILKVLEIQGENSKRMSAHDFLLGNSI